MILEPVTIGWIAVISVISVSCVAAAVLLAVYFTKRAADRRNSRKAEEKGASEGMSGTFHVRRIRSEASGESLWTQHNRQEAVK